MYEEKLKALEMIQGIINRMAGNSFSVKGFTASITAASITIECLNVKINELGFAFIFVMWLTDAYYLSLERKYRNLFSYIRLDKIKDYFNFNPNQKFENLSFDEEDKIVNSNIFMCFFAIHNLAFYILMYLLLK